MKELRIGICSKRISYWGLIIASIFSYYTGEKVEIKFVVISAIEILFYELFGSNKFLEDLEYFIVDDNPYGDIDKLIQKTSKWQVDRDLKIIYGEEAYNEENRS